MTFEADDDVPESIVGDRSRTRQVLLNLVGNATKFTHVGEVGVRLGVEAGANGAERIRAQVSDTGIGIAADRLAALFEPFAQADATTTRRYGGTGLGLCVASQLVELLGGEIGVQSAPGEGSTFWFTLPCERLAAVDRERVTVDLTGAKVLIVDDDSAVRAALEQQVARWGISPVSVADGLGAVRLLDSAARSGRPFEAALIDLTMEQPGGFELGRTISSNPRMRATRLVLLSTEEIADPEVRAAGFDATISKPVSGSKLYDQLVTLLTYRGKAAVAPAPAAHGAAGHSPTPPVPTHERTVLVVDDNEINRFAARSLLTKLGYEVEIATGGKQAIELTGGGREYEAVFMDCQMPDVDGYTATALIRERDAGRRRLPIVAMTAHTMEGDRERCLEAGMDDYVAKPLRLEAIAAVCERLSGLAA
jgi:CheY-like chemotaxis protein